MNDTGKTPTKILLVDDERLLLDIYEASFKRSGYDVTTYTFATEALTALRGGYVPNIILFDINMPEMGGFEFLETVKREHLAPLATMIALTNESQNGETERIVQLGGDGHYVKSQLSPSDIVSAIDDLIRTKGQA